MLKQHEKDPFLSMTHTPHPQSMGERAMEVYGEEHTFTSSLR